MRKKLLLSLAAFAVAITLGRGTSAVSVAADRLGESNIQLTFGLPTRPSATYAFGLPTRPSATYAFGLPTRPSATYAFGLPTRPSATYAFGLPTRPSATYAFGLPTRPSATYAFGLPTRPASSHAGLSKSSVRVAMLPLGAETGRHIPRENADLEKSAKDLELGKSTVSNPLAMLPLGRETGRHVRTDSEKDVDVETGKHQGVIPVAELREQLGTGYAMLPLGAEMGRHIRNLNEDNKENEKTVVASAPKATA